MRRVSQQISYENKSDPLLSLCGVLSELKNVWKKKERTKERKKEKKKRKEKKRKEKKERKK